MTKKKRAKTKDYNINSKNVEWYTPPNIIEAATTFFDGEIDFDPASSIKANETVKAKKFYSLKDNNENGLELPWYDGMWLNPPYYPTVNTWVVQALDYYAGGFFKNKGALILLRGDSKGVRLLRAICPFVECHRIKFLRPNGTYGNNPIPGSSIYFLGDHRKEELFKELFQKFGIPLRRW